MNRKGFTLVELLTVIVLVGLIAMIAIPNFMNVDKDAKEKSYKILINSIVTASQTYFEECEYGDLNDFLGDDKYNEYKCNIVTVDNQDSYIETTLSTLANTGLLKVDKLEENDENNIHSNIKKKVINPINDDDISSCRIKITKNITTGIEDSNGISNKVVSYNVTSIDTNSICPAEYK